MCIRSTFHQLPRSPGGNQSPLLAMQSPLHLLLQPLRLQLHQVQQCPPGPMPLSRQAFALVPSLCLGHPSLDPHVTPPHFPRRFFQPASAHTPHSLPPSTEPLLIFLPVLQRLTFSTCRVIKVSPVPECLPPGTSSRLFTATSTMPGTVLGS